MKLTLCDWQTLLIILLQRSTLTRQLPLPAGGMIPEKEMSFTLIYLHLIALINSNTIFLDNKMLQRHHEIQH